MLAKFWSRAVVSWAEGREREGIKGRGRRVGYCKGTIHGESLLTWAPYGGRDNPQELKGCYYQVSCLTETRKSVYLQDLGHGLQKDDDFMVILGYIMSWRPAWDT